MALDLGAHLEKVADMTDFLALLSSLLPGGELSTGTDNTAPVTRIRQAADGVTLIENQNGVFVASEPDTTMVASNGAIINLLAPGVANVVLGATATTMEFINMSAITLTAGSAPATIVADGGSHTFISGKGALTVTGGAGADNYVYHMDSALMTIQDFSVARGDILKIDKALQGSMRQTPDNQGGTMLSFGSASAGIDVKGVVALPSTSIYWV